MKKIKLLVLFAFMFMATSGFSTLWAFCINGNAYFVITDGNGNVLHQYQNGTCSPDGFLWKSVSIAVISQATSEDGDPAPSGVYGAINDIDLITDTICIPPDTITKYTTASGTAYYVDPFLLDQDIAEALAKADGLSIYGLKILGNPFPGHDVHYKVLSDVAQIVQVKVTGASFTFTTNVSVSRGLNDLYVNVSNSVSGPAYFKIGTSNKARTIINFQ